MKRAPLITGLLLISTSCAYASSGGCGADSTSGATNYSSVVDDVTVNQTDNVTGREFTSATLSSTNWQYACSCSAGKAVKLVYMVSPVLTTTGHQTGYYKLNDSLDIKTTLQANDIPGLTTDQVVSVNTRFTQIKSSTVYSAATQTGVCQGDTSRYGPVNIGANTTFTLYVTKPFLGSMTIPKTDIAVIKGAWVDGMGSPSTGDFHDLVKLSIQGNLTAPQSCKINQGDVIKVNFGFINGQKFTTRNAMPDGFTPVDFDITYDCGDTSKIKNSLQMHIDGTTGVVDQYNLVARRRSSDNVPDVGIRIENLGGGVANIPFQNGILPVDPSGHGTVNMRAWPVNLVGGELETGKFQGTATITVMVR
ncbi:fimbrial protein [Escherichia coli]|nr:fimbrial protein [Escherichia coli]EJK1280553.1 fimbrial protein [Escherichia coli]NUC51800.1 fimbrial protein [Escherichia coli]NUD09606.1 fimbrial protein [Escherichia coli]NUD52813.1 fimbrial protein [Escherichia coli]